MASSSIQFFGRDAALQAFELRNIEVWSLWQGKSMLTKGEGAQDLSNFLDMIANGGTNAIYTIKVYEDLTEAKKVKSNTPDDGSFNFRLNDPNMMPMQSTLTSMGSPGGYHYEMKLLRDELAELKALKLEDEDEDEPLTIAGLLRDPEHLGKLIDVGQKLLGMLNPGAVQPALIGNVNRVGQTAQPVPAPGAAAENKLAQPGQGTAEEIAEQRLVRLGTALDTLEKNDPLIVEHLEKLASVANKDPEKFKSLISILDVWN